MQETLEFDQMVNRVAGALRAIPRRAGVLAVNFSKDRFRSQSWVDNIREPWKKRKAESWGRKPRKGRAILVDSGRLRRSIRVISTSPDRVVIGTDVPYAEAHNEGFTGKITQKVKAHTRRKFGRIQSTNIETRKRSSRRGQVGGGQVKAHTRIIDQKIPRRRFIGSSALLNRQLERMITVEIVRAVKNKY